MSECPSCKAADAIYESGCPGCEARALDSINQGSGMTRDDIFQWAMEAELIQGRLMAADPRINEAEKYKLAVQLDQFERFAQLVAAHEREQCAKLAKSLWYIDGQYTADEFAEAIRNRGNA